jgi:hypothetical protein
MTFLPFYTFLYFISVFIQFHMKTWRTNMGYTWSFCCMVKLDWWFIIIYTRNRFSFSLLTSHCDRVSTSGNLLIFQKLYFLFYNPMVKFITNIFHICPTRWSVTHFILSGNCSTYFGCYHHPSSGTQITVSTASGICHNVTVICRYRGRVGTVAPTLLR